MKKIPRTLSTFQILLVLNLCLFVPATFGSAFSYIPGIKEHSVNCLKLSPGNPGVVYAGTARALYQSLDAGQNWRQIPEVRGAINDIGIDSSGAVFVATDEGLFLNLAGRWQKPYRSQEPLQKIVQAVAIDDSGKIIAIATKAGLFYSLDSVRTWQKLTNADDSSFSAVKFSPFNAGLLYASSTKGLFKIDLKQNTSERIFVISQEEQGEQDASEDSEQVEYEEPVTTSNLINCIFLSAGDKKSLYLATQRGIFVTSDEKDWQKFNEDGLLSKEIRDIHEDSQGNLYAATDKGLFRFRKTSQQWQAIYKGISSQDIKDVEIDQKAKNLWLATGQGLFRGEIDIRDFERYEDKVDFANNEPTINEIQKEAIQYAEVYPDKIKGWRTAVAKKAFLPRVTIGADRYVTDLIHWDSGQNPDLLLKGKDSVSWDISLSWDLGDLIWNSYQKDIDVRSRLMVQLRPLNVYIWSLS